MKKVIPGQPLSITAADHNQMVDAAQAQLRASQAVPGGRPGRDRLLPSIVTVFNKTGDLDEADAVDWPIWHPVLVGYTDSPLGLTPITFAERPYFPGYNCDRADYHTAYPVLGITQEPIRAGLSGEVCIAGPTLALMHKVPTGWTNQAGWDRVHVFKYGDRWTLRNGYGGDARLLKILDVTNLYEDGTYDDRYLAWIDLSEVPERVWMQNNTGSALPPHSIVRRATTGLATKLAASSVAYTAPNEDLVASAGYQIAAGAIGWGFRLGESPVKVRYALDANPAIGATIGPASNSLYTWPELPGLEVIATDWYKAGENRYAWVRRRQLPFWAKADGLLGNAWLCTTGGAQVYDGGTYGGVVYPTCKAAVDYDRLYDPGVTLQRYPNVQSGQIFLCDAVRADGHLMANAAVFDDPIGTVKIWISANDPPPGWRIYSALEGKFPVGYSSGDSDFDPVGATAGAKTHTHPVGAAMGTTGTDYGAASHLPPYRVVRFIERYQ